MKCTQCGAQVEGDFCPYCGTAAEVKTQENNVQQPKVEMQKKSNNNGNKVKKPFYKKWWVWVIAAIVIFGMIGKLGGNNGSSVDISEFEWNNITLAEMLPEPESNLGSYLINTEDYFSVDVHEMSKDAYKEYVDGCREKGFTVEVNEYDGYYSASNEAGFELMLYYFDDEQKMSIDLTAPSEDVAETDETETSESEGEKISFTLVAGDKGEYGETRIFNKGTDMEIERIYYLIPAGTYTVTNIGEYMSTVNVYKDETHKTEEGWEEPVVGYASEMIDVNKTDEIIVEEGYAIYISEPSKFKFEGTIASSSNEEKSVEKPVVETKKAYIRAMSSYSLYYIFDTENKTVVTFASNDTYVDEGKYTGELSTGVTITWDHGQWTEKFTHSSGSSATMIDGSGNDWSYTVCDLEKAENRLNEIQ